MSTSFLSVFYGGSQDSNAIEIERQMLTSLVLFIVIFAAAFNFAVSYSYSRLKRNKDEAGESLLDAVAKELALLGFITTILFVVTETGYMTKVNKAYFGAETNEAKEVFEAVHIFVFMVMASFLFEGLAFLLILWRLNVFFRLLDRLNIIDLGVVLEREAEDSHFWKVKWHRFSEWGFASAVLDPTSFFGLKQRFLCLGGTPLFPHPTSDEGDNAAFSSYLYRITAKFITNLIEIPISSLLALLCISFLLRKILDFQGRNFLFSMVILSFYLLVASIFCACLINSSLSRLTPDREKVSKFIRNEAAALKGTINDEIMTTKQRAVSRRFNTAGLLKKKTEAALLLADEIFEAEIDSMPTVAKDCLGKTRIRNESLFLFSRQNFVLRIIQLLIVLHAAFVAALFTGAVTHAHSSADAFKNYGWYMVPTIILLVGSSSFVISVVLGRTAIVSSLDFGVDKKQLAEVSAQIADRRILRDSGILSFLLQKAKICTLKPNTDDLKAQAQQEFSKLPKHHQDTIKLTFASLAKNYAIFGTDEAVPGVLLREDAIEGFRVLSLASDDVDKIDYETMKGQISSWTSAQGLGAKSFLTFSNFVLVVMVFSNLTTLLKGRGNVSSDDLESLFDFLDSDGDGLILAEDFLDALDGIYPPVSESEARRLTSTLRQGESELTKEAFISGAMKTFTRFQYNTRPKAQPAVD